MAVEISIAGDVLTETDFDNPYLRFVVTLSEASETPITVDFTTLPGTTDVDDFFYAPTGSENNGTVTFNPGETSKSVYIRIDSDTVDERDESVFLRLANPVGAVFPGYVNSLTALGFVLDDDGLGLNIALGSPGGEIRETGLDAIPYEIPVELSRPSSTPLTFGITATAGSAVPNADFRLVDNTVTFQPGQTTASVTIEVIGDKADELDETIVLEFAPQAGASFAGIIPPVTVLLRDGPAVATNGNDVIIGTEYRDAFDGLAGNDSIAGMESADTIIGGLGNDTLDGGTNPEGPTGQGDILLGGAGNDTYYVDSGLDLVDEDAYFPGFGSGGFDTIISTTDFYWDIASVGERIVVSEDVVDFGGDGVTIVGGIFNNTLEGHSGTDIAFGRGGADTYRLGDGVDWISLSLLGTEGAYDGINGSNTVIVEQRETGFLSYDIIFEFEVGRDKIDVSDYAAINGFSTGADVVARAVNDGLGNSYIALGDGLDYLYMVGLEKAELAAGDFLVA